MFDLARFRRLLNAHWAEQWLAHAWFLGIGVMVHFVVTLIVLSGRPSYSTEAQMVLFVTGLLLTAPLFAARCFQGLARPESALLFLMRPASGFEKWLLAFLMVMVFYPLAYALAFQVCHLPAWAFEHARVLAMNAQMLADGIEISPGEKPESFAFWHPWRFEEWLIPAVMLLMLSFVQSFAVLGSLWFRHLPLVKTLLAAFLLFLATLVLDEVFRSAAPWLEDFDRATAPWQMAHFLAVWFGIPLLLWLACYFAVRERELA